MSFPFYSRLSSKPSKSKDAKESSSKHISASFATGAFNQGDTASRGNNSSTHVRTSSKMRILPFLGKRRKSLATLRPGAVLEEEGLGGGENGGVSHGGGLGRRHNKTVSQLANETAARLARTSFGAAGSRSTSNLELPPFESSPFRLGLGSEYMTPVKARNPEARHTMFPSGSTLNSTPEYPSVAQNKRASEKPAKTSFLSRISSRPSLSARYSSADLKSGSKSRGFFKSSDKPTPANATLERKEIVHPVYPANRQTLGDDKDFFISPRAAPTPPNLRFASPDSSLLDSPVGPSRSEVTLPSQKQSPLFGTVAPRSPGHASIRQANAAARHASSPTTATNPTSLSPEMALRTPRRHSISVNSHRLSPNSTKDSISISASGSPAARLRTSHVRIGTEKVTISVANMLEAELGVEVGDSDSSYYDDSFESSRRIVNPRASPGRTPANESTSFNSSSELPPLSNSADGFDVSFKFPKIKEKTGREFALEAQSPLSALISASSGDKDYVPSPISPARKSPAGEAQGDMRDTDADEAISKYAGNFALARGRAAQNARSAYLSSLGSQSREVDRLDRISERSVSVRQESPRDTELQDKKRLATESKNAKSPAVASQLQRALDAQCARFDKLAGHLLQIIQRHQNEKVQLESQISALQKEARRNEREIKALRKLIAHSDKRDAQEGWRNRRLVRIASMQSILSDISARDEEEVDMSVAVEMLARAGRRNVLASPDISREIRASVDLSPCIPQTNMLKNADLRRSKTMPDLHKASATTASPVPSTPLDATPDISGLGLGLDFPLPEPLKLPSIASTIMSSAKNSSASVPALTAAPTVASGLSLATEPGANDSTASAVSPPDSKSSGVGRGGGRNARQKRMAGEWRPGASHALYHPSEKESAKPPSAPPTCAIPALPASASYANNLNKALMASPIDQVLKKDSPDLDAIYQKLVATSNGLLE